MKQYLYAIVLGLLIASHGWAYFSGVRSEKQREVAAVAKAKTREDELLAQLQAAQAKREVIYRDRIKTIQAAPDPSGCADTAVPSDLADQLRPEDR